MNCLIQIENGQPVNHPVTLDNFRAAFPYINVFDLPPNWAPFLRVALPDGLLTTPFQRPICTYTLSSDGKTWQDTWSVQDMTAEEKAALIAEYQATPPSPNMMLDTETLRWVPATAKPTDGQNYLWKRDIGEWAIVPVKPTDGQYYFDWTTMNWAVIPVAPTS